MVVLFLLRGWMEMMGNDEAVGRTLLVEDLKQGTYLKVVPP